MADRVSALHAAQRAINTYEIEILECFDRIYNQGVLVPDHREVLDKLDDFKSIQDHREWLIQMSGWPKESGPDLDFQDMCEENLRLNQELQKRDELIRELRSVLSKSPR